MAFLSRIVPLALVFSFFACGGGQSGFESLDGACLRNDGCQEGELCVMGVCSATDGLAPLDVSAINASQWFSHGDGHCSYDTDCGPWVCQEAECVVPTATMRPSPSHVEFRYFDGSCNFSSDCGPWACADGWCTQPGYESPTSVLASDENPPAGMSCLSDDRCADGEDCVFPGQCVSGAATEQMTFADIAALEWFTNDDGSCSGDAQCGPHVCDGGYCVAAELAGVDLPDRSAFHFHDGSCSEDDHCGPWTCHASGWCQNPSRTP